MFDVRLEDKENRLEIILTEEPDRTAWADLLLRLSVRLQSLGSKGLECLIDISAMNALSAYSKERIFAMRDLCRRQGFEKVTVQVSTIGEATRLTHKRRAEVLAGVEAYRCAA